MIQWTAHENTHIRDHSPASHMPWLDEQWFAAHGINDQPFNIGEALTRPTPDKDPLPAVAGGDGVLTYRELRAKACAFAQALRRVAAVRPGDAVVLALPNSARYVACVLAVFRLGAVAVPCSPFLSAAEVAAVVAQTSASLVIQDNNEGSSPTLTLTLDELSAEAGRHQDAENIWVGTAPTDPATVLFTSGSTGTPKGCIHYHRDLIVAGETYGRDIVPVRPGDVVVGSPSIAFAYGMEVLLLTPLRWGALSILPDDPSPAGLLRALERHGATHLYSTPTLYRALTEVADQHALRGLRYCVSAGESPSRTLAEQWLRLSGCHLANGLGTTEFNAFLLGSPPGVGPLGSTGKAVEGFQLRLVDSDGAEVPAGTMGRLLARGPTGCRYFRNPEEQAARVQDGWSVVGDVFECDEDGFYWSRGRLDDLIIRGGVNIAPSEIEASILALGSVKECAAVGVLHPELDTQLIYAFLVPHQGTPIDSRAVRARLGASLPPHKIPDRVIVSEALPRNANGKVQRRILQGMARRAGRAPAEAVGST
jgi:2-aminobenzoate-CoA ligase